MTSENEEVLVLVRFLFFWIVLFIVHNDQYQINNFYAFKLKCSGFLYHAI